MEKKIQFIRKLVLLTLLMLGGGLAFGATPVVYDCSAGATWGGYTLEPATKVNNVYEINTPGKLAWFSCQVNNKHSGNVGDNAKLTADIKMNPDNANEADKKFWIPICAGTGGQAKDGITYCKYSGTFDGDNHKISNLYMNSDFLEQMNVYYTQNVGFIGAFSGTVKKLTLENIQVLGSGDGGTYVDGGDCVTRPVSIGTLVGWSSGKVENCIVSGNIVTSGIGQAVGGLVGNAGGGSITGSVSEVAIDASGLAYAGGIVGYTKNNVSISSCVYAGSGVSSEGSAEVGTTTYYSKAGGIVGSRYSGTVTATNVYYDGTNEDGSTIGAIGNGSLGASSTAYGSSDVNQEEVACVLNGGTWSEETCVGATSSAWSVGFLGLSYEGSDGYMVTFDANGGGFPSGAKKYNVVISGTTVTTNGISIPSRDGYAFLGWSRNKNATTPDENLGEVNGQTTVYAVWNPMIEITFNANGGYFPPDPSTTTKTKLVPTGDPITVEGIEPLPEKYCTGTVNGENCNGGKWMYFRGWSFNDGASVSEAVDLNQLTTLASSENTTLYAIWTETETYTVTFHAEGHGKTKVAFTETAVQGGGLIDEPAPGFAVPDEGYEFDGWWTEEKGGSLFNFVETPITQSIILHAHWKATEYEITCVNASCDPDHQTYNIESDFAFYTPTKPGYTFDGWFYEDQFSTKAEGVKPGATGPLTIYAKWSEATYTIAYRAGGAGNGEVLPETVNYGTSYTLRGISYTREGYVQDGWSLLDNGEKDYELKAKIAITGHLVLYPHWCKGTRYGAVTVTENADGTKIAFIDGEYGAKINTNERDAVAIPNNIDVSSVIMSRKFPVNVYSTIVLPFSVNTENVEGLSAVLYYNGIKTENNKSTIRMKVLWAEDNLIMGENGQYVHYNDTNMLANTPYLLMMKDETFAIKSEAYPITLERTTSAEEDANGSGWTFRGTWKYKEWGSSCSTEGQNCDRETGNAYGFSAAASGDKINVGDFVRVGEGAWIRPMRAYLVKTSIMAAMARANGAYVKRPSVVQEELPEIMSIVIDNGRDDEEQTTVIGHFNTRTGEIKMIPQNRTFDIKGRNVGNKANKARGAYYGKKVLKK